VKQSVTLPELRESAHQLTVNLLPRKANYDAEKTYRDFHDWYDSSAFTGQFYESLLTPFFTITGRLNCTRVIAHFPTFKGLEKLYVTNPL
jgi:hypothetical protein